MLPDVFDWERRNGSTPTLITGPLSDHTTGGIQLILAKLSYILNVSHEHLIRIDKRTRFSFIWSSRITKSTTLLTSLSRWPLSPH